MTNEPTDKVLLVRATLRLYFHALVDAFGGWRKNWWIFGIHLAYFVVLWLGASIVGVFLGPASVAGGFLMGLLLAYILASYLSTVLAGVNKEKFVVSRVFQSANELLIPVIGVLFMFFVLNGIAALALARPGQEWLRHSLSLLLAVLFNPLPEVIYCRSGGPLDAFSEAFEFVKENFIEWFLPVLVMLAPLVIIDPQGLVDMGIIVAANNPLLLLEAFFSIFAAPALLIRAAPLVVLFLICLYYISLFRGVLFRELSRSTRRKRIFQERAR